MMLAFPTLAMASFIRSASPSAGGVDHNPELGPLDDQAQSDRCARPGEIELLTG